MRAISSLKAKQSSGFESVKLWADSIAYVLNLAQVIPSVFETSGKPFIVTMPPTSSAIEAVKVEEIRRKYRDWYLERRIPVFDSLQQAASVLGKIVQYNEFRERRGL